MNGIFVLVLATESAQLSAKGYQVHNRYAPLRFPSNQSRIGILFQKRARSRLRFMNRNLARRAPFTFLFTETTWNWPTLGLNYG